MASRDVPRPELVVDDDGTFDPMTGLQDLGALWLNESTGGLYRALLCGPGRPPGSDHLEAVSLFRRHHAEESEGAELTALLLVTERRWRGAAARVMREIEALAILDEDALDHLAELFVWADDLWVDCRREWLEPEVDAAHADTPVPLRRDLRPSVRRWAAERRVRRDADDVATLLRRARALGELVGGAVVNGVLDAAEALDGDERALALDAGLAWSRAEVRRRALEVLVDAGRGEEAFDLAARDPAKQVRRWAAKLEASLAARTDAPPACSPQEGDRPDEADDREPAQGSLFP